MIFPKFGENWTECGSGVAAVKQSQNAIKSIRKKTGDFYSCKVYRKVTYRCYSKWAIKSHMVAQITQMAGGHVNIWLPYMWHTPIKVLHIWVSSSNWLEGTAIKMVRTEHRQSDTWENGKWVNLDYKWQRSCVFLFPRPYISQSFTGHLPWGLTLFVSSETGLLIKLHLLGVWSIPPGILPSASNHTLQFNI